MALQLIPKRRALPNPSLVHLFSSTSADPDERNEGAKSSFASYFSDVKSSLRQQQQKSSSSLSSSPPPPPLHRLRRSPPIPPPRSAPHKAPSLEELRKNLTLFRRAAESSPPPREDYAPSPPSHDHLSMESIGNSLRNLKSKMAAGEQTLTPLSTFRNSLRVQPSDSFFYSPPPASKTVIRGTEDLPASVFAREMREKTKGEGGSDDGASMLMKTEFVKMYNYAELGDKLRSLRPEGKKKQEGWFSIEELSGRLMKLREMEEKTELHRAGLSLKDLRESLVNLRHSADDRVKRTSIDKLDILGNLGKTPTYMTLPPKEHLLQTYNHPDNMSAAEKMKIELAKVREEFKMSESDCGSTRVQVALLTTKIKYLSSVLHKQDKHSRKGLVQMVHNRKRLLKYLRRTDWDSYCFVLDKLGLRDISKRKIMR